MELYGYLSKYWLSGFVIGGTGNGGTRTTQGPDDVTAILTYIIVLDKHNIFCIQMKYIIFRIDYITKNDLDVFLARFNTVSINMTTF